MPLFFSYQAFQHFSTPLSLIALTQVFLEEYGHYLDDQLNKEDTPGDEGEYFATLAMSQTLSDSDLLRLRSENDWAVVTIDGLETAIQQNFSGFNIVQITNNNFDDGVAFDFYLNKNDNYGDKLRVSGNKIAWQSDEGIYLFDGFIPRALSNNSTDKDPQIQGNSVVWDGDSGIFLYDGRQTTRLIGSNGISARPQVYDGRVVWQNGEFGGSILFYDGSRVVKLEEGGYTPRIYQNNIVWAAPRTTTSFTGDIYYNNGGTVRQISPQNSFYNFSPFVSSQLIAWSENPSFNNRGGSTFDETNSFRSVYIYDINTEQTTQLSSASAIRDLQVSDSYAVWQEGSNENVSTAIMFYNGATVRNLSIDKRGGEWDSNPTLFGNKVAWERWDGLDYEVMYFDGNTTRQVTNNNQDDRYPQLSNEIIGWTGYDGSDWEIYQTYIGPSNTLRDKLTTTLVRFRNEDKPGTYLYAGEQEAASIRQNYRNFIEEGPAFQVAMSQTDPLLQPFYRFRNSSPGREGTYLFAGAQESVSIRQNYSNFVEEGIAFYTYSGGVGGGMTNFNRFQNNDLPGTYLFAGPSESGAIVGSQYPFSYEGPAFAAG